MNSKYSHRFLVSFFILICNLTKVIKLNAAACRIEICKEVESHVNHVVKTRNTREEVRQLVDGKGDILKTKDGLVALEMDYGATFNLQSSKNTQTEIMHNPTSVRVS